MDLITLLKAMVKKQGSELYLTVGVSPTLKTQGRVITLSQHRLTLEETTQIVHSLMNDVLKKEFVRTNECNFAFEAPNVGRFRVSAFMQRNQPGCVIRHIQTLIPTIETLQLPSVVKTLAMMQKGIVIVAGAAGAGKTTTLAAMIGYRNLMGSGHIITIEDPIEYLHEHHQSIITQREVGVDTSSYETALRNALRQAPDVVQMGEIRDANMMRYALSFAEAGHLCLATVHANNVVQVLERLSHFYNEENRHQLWTDLSLHLRAILAQKMIPTEESSAIAMEVLINTPIVAERIRNGHARLLKDYMMRKNSQGMQTFDQSLYHLCMTAEIKYQDALMHADSIDNLRLMIKLKTPTPDLKKERSTDPNFSVASKDDLSGSGLNNP